MYRIRYVRGKKYIVVIVVGNNHRPESFFLGVPVAVWSGRTASIVRLAQAGMGSGKKLTATPKASKPTIAQPIYLPD